MNEPILIDPAIAELIPGFLGNCRRDICRILDAVRANELEAARRIAHRLQGAGGAFGFDQISLHGAGIVQACRAGAAKTATLESDRLLEFLDQVQVRYR